MLELDLHLLQSGILLGHLERFGRDIQGLYVRFREGLGQGDGDAATTRADVQEARGGVGRPIFQDQIHQFSGLWPGNQDSRSHS